MPANYRPFSIVEVLDARINGSGYRKGEKTKFALMKAAAELLADHSYVDVRNIDISQKAKVSAGILNTYFADKHDLIAQLLGLFVENLHAHYEPLREDLKLETDTYVIIHRRIDYMINVSLANPGPFRLLVVESPNFPNMELTRLRETSLQFWADDLTALFPDEKAGVKLSKRDKMFRANMLGSMVDEAIRFNFHARELGKNYPAQEIVKYPPQKMIDTLAELRYSAIFGADPSPESKKKARATKTATGR